MKKLSAIMMFALFVTGILAIAQETVSTNKLTGADAAKYAGQTQTVCGVVASARYLSTGKNQPTFLNLDKAHPHQTFTIVIWGEDLKNFPVAPEQFYTGKVVCVTGLITLHKEKPQMEIKSPAQIRVEKSN
jgi:hypothetical protein